MGVISADPGGDPVSPARPPALGREARLRFFKTGQFIQSLLFSGVSRMYAYPPQSLAVPRTHRVRVFPLSRGFSARRAAADRCVFQPHCCWLASAALDAAERPQLAPGLMCVARGARGSGLLNQHAAAGPSDPAPRLRAASQSFAGIRFRAVAAAASRRPIKHNQRRRT